MTWHKKCRNKTCQIPELQPLRKGFHPFKFITTKRHVNRHHRPHAFGFHDVITANGTGGDKAMQDGFIALLLGAFKEIALVSLKELVK